MQPASPAATPAKREVTGGEGALAWLVPAHPGQVTSARAPAAPLNPIPTKPRRARGPYPHSIPPRRGLRPRPGSTPLTPSLRHSPTHPTRAVCSSHKPGTDSRPNPFCLRCLGNPGIIPFPPPTPPLVPPTLSQLKRALASSTLDWLSVWGPGGGEPLSRW